MLGSSEEETKEKGDFQGEKKKASRGFDPEQPEA